tara:strand:+ start:24 stop:437 length:414 start_codon:yes stop_codon:yes gene_type:complete
MKKCVQLLFVFLFIITKFAYSSEKINLISFDDLNIIFSNNLKNWNQNIIFLDKKENMEKIQYNNIDSYTLKTYFDYGYVLITPIFINSNVETLTIVYHFNYNNINIDLISTHFQSFQNYCSKLHASKERVIINILKC